MRPFGLLLVVPLLVGVVGCTDSAKTPADPTTPETPAETPPATPVTLAEGSATAGNGEVAFFKITEPGTLTGTVTWSAPPATMDAGFVHKGVLLDLDAGGSPLTTSQTVTAALVAGGTGWGFYIGNAGPAKKVSYKVTFAAD